MLMRAGSAIVVGLVAFFVVIAVAFLLHLSGIKPAEAIAGFLNTWAVAIGIVVGLWYFFKGSL